MEKNPPEVKLAYAAFAVFADDGTVNARELDLLLKMAMEDGVISDGEKRVLANVFDKLSPDTVAPEVWERIQFVRLQHGF